MQLPRAEHGALAPAIDAACRATGARLVCADVAGLFASVFCDFGDAFVVHDKDGEQAASCVIGSITQDARALVTVLAMVTSVLGNGEQL